MPELFLALILAGILTYLIVRASGKQTVQDSEQETELLVEKINALLPQTQCEECGYPGCRPYARAIVHTNETIDRCPPGGSLTSDSIARVLGRSRDFRSAAMPAAMVAVVDVETCIGCVKCIKACPVDAIIGAAKQLHAVIPGLCTGCKLCIPPCPVDCITLEPADIGHKLWSNPAPDYNQRQ